ncbi:MAG: LemA family protein [Patescibacteria group bacterium]|jgi:LemA protein
MKAILIIIGILVVGAAIYSFSFYNSLITGAETVDNQWAQVETQYQRRFDLIPNLVDSVKGIMKQEQEVFGAIAEARTRYSGATTVDEKAGAATEVESALSRLLVVMENYPELKSSENVTTLMVQLEGTENRISVERGRFNDEVKSYNLLVKRFPGNLFAKLLGFSERAYFEAAEGSAAAPDVSF